MPSVIKSFDWFVRIDGAKDVMTSKLQQILGWVDCKRLLSAHHVGDKKENPHIHMCLSLSSQLQKQSLDTRLKKVFEWETSRQYSSKPWDGADAACSYLFHESTADVIANRGFTDIDIQRFKLLNENVQKVVAVNKERGTNRVVERVLTEIGPGHNRRDILTILITMIRAGEMYEPGDFRLKTIIEEIYCKSRNNEDMDNYIYERYHAIYRN